MGCPMEEIVFPTDPRGVAPAIEIPDNVCPTLETVEPIDVRLVAIVPVSRPLVLNDGKVALAVSLRYSRVTWVEFIAFCADDRELSAFVSKFEVVF